MKGILQKALLLEGAVVESARLEGTDVVVSVRPRARLARRCPVCGARCPGYDSPAAPRRWRTVDLGAARRHLEYAPAGVECPEHGVLVEAVPRARRGARFSRALEDLVAWLSARSCRSVVAELARVDRKGVGPVCERVRADLEARDGGPRLSGLRRIGVDETSYKKGHKHVTVVVDHDRNRVVWAAEGHGKAQLGAFFDLLGERASPTGAVTADGARRIAEVVAERRPGAVLAMDPFHVTGWATDALDELRRQAWRDARAAGEPARAREARSAKYPLPKNPEDLTDSQSARPGAVARADPRLWRGYLPKEGLRDVFKAEGAGEAAARPGAWLASACRCRIAPFVELSRKVGRRRDSIVAAVGLGLSNARVEATNNKIKPAVRMGYGFRNIGNLIALVMLRCSDLKPSLPRAVG